MLLALGYGTQLSQHPLAIPWGCGWRASGGLCEVHVSPLQSEAVLFHVDVDVEDVDGVGWLAAAAYVDQTPSRCGGKPCLGPTVLGAGWLAIGRQQ